MRIAIDAMGGDHAPSEIVSGVVQVANQIRGQLVLVGQEPAIRTACPNLPSNVCIVHADEVIGMEDKPTESLRKKRNSSIVVGADLVKKGEADAFVSAGNTGAVTAACLLSWRTIAEVHRPAIATTIPNAHSLFLLLDAGASPDVDPEHLVEFSLMGLAYAERVMGRPKPKVHLLNIGEEPGKGNAFAKAAYDLMAPHDWFAGNIEGKDVFRQPCDVVVCDAFVGNIVLKTGEGVAEFIMNEMRAAVPKGPGKLLFLPLKKAFAPLRKKLDYAEYGGSPLLGLNGVCIISHGRSNAKAIANATLNAAKAVENQLVQSIHDHFQAETQRHS